MNSLNKKTQNLKFNLLKTFFLFCFLSLFVYQKSLGQNQFKPNEHQNTFSPQMKKNDFIPNGECQNQSGLPKNLNQLGKFIPTAIMSNDDRCEMNWSSDASEDEKSLYGVGVIRDFSGNCKNSEGGSCEGSAHLVLDQNILITAAHVFLDQNTNKFSDGKGFQFIIMVWVPPDLRQNPDIEYEYRRYEVEKIYIAQKFPKDALSKDYAFVKLKEPVGVSVGKKLGKDSKGNFIYGSKRHVDAEYLVRPLPFKRLDDSRFSKLAQTVSFQGDKNKINKQCVLFHIYKDPYYPEILNHDGDIVNGGSGSAVIVKDETGIFSFAGVNVMSTAIKKTEYENLPYDYPNRYNSFIEGNSFYDDFIKFRKQFKQVSLVPEWIKRKSI